MAEIALIPSEGCILIAKKIPIENVLKCKFSPKDTGKKICYSAGAVEAITEAFELNFSEHVSVSYDEVEFAIFDDSVPYAIVSVYNKYPNVNAG